MDGWRRISHAIAGADSTQLCARGADLTTSRRVSFVWMHSAGGGLAAICLIAYILSGGAGDALIIAALVWLTAPAALAVLVNRTGRLDTAHILSAGHHAALVTVVAAFTGGLASFIIPWLIIVPVEAALSGARRVIAAAFGFTLAAVAILSATQLAALLPVPRDLGVADEALRIIGLVSAGLYGCLVAMTVEVQSRHSQAVARDSAALYRLMADNATDLISAHEVNGRATFVSHGATRLFGRDPPELLDQGFLEAVSVGERPSFVAAISDAARGNRETAVTYRLAGGADGSEPVWVETRCRPISAGDGGLAGNAAIVAVTRDISGARVREDELRRARDEAEEASRSKSRFLANVSHELRTPLNAVIGFSEVLAERLASDDNYRREHEFVQLIAESGAHLLSIVNDLLDMSRIEANRYEIAPVALSMSDMFSACVNLMGATGAAAGVTFVADPGTPPVELLADARALKQIILNLLSNAVKFSNAGGTVTLRAREVDATVEIEVIDQGIGIAQSDIGRLGEPFFQADGDYGRKFAGTGLGLSVVKGLVGLHRGELRVSSVLGDGTTVTVRLPRMGCSAPGNRADCALPPKPAEMRA